MNRFTMNEALPYDDVQYTKSFLREFACDNLTFEQLLEIVPSSINLANLMVLINKAFNDEQVKKICTKIVNHYYNRLNQVDNFSDENLLNKFLTVKEVLFLTDHIEIEKILEGKEIDFAEEIRWAFKPVREKCNSLITNKVIGNSRSKSVIKIAHYNSIFNKEKYLKNPTGYVSPEGNISYVTEKIVDDAETILSENNLFPARFLVERYLFETCKKQALNDEEKSL